jgi:hypothetical protein
MRKVINVWLGQAEVERLAEQANARGITLRQYVKSLIEPVANPANEGLAFYLVGLDQADAGRLLEHAKSIGDDDVDGLLDIIVNHAIREATCTR